MQPSVAGASRELHGFVDEEEEEPPKEKSFWPDPDELFKYKTFRIVQIKDRRLGMLYWGIVALVTFYIVVFALLINGKHQNIRHGLGAVITKFNGKAFVGESAYDAADLRFPEVEPNGAFIATRIVTSEVQARDGKCVDYDSPCPCREGAKCVGADGGEATDGYCEDVAWCPSLGEGNVDTFAESYQQNVKTMEGLENTKIDILAGIGFPGLQTPNFYVAGKVIPEGKDAPPPIAVGGKKQITGNPLKHTTLGEIHAKCENCKSLDDMIKNGALVTVMYLWNCDVDLGCSEPKVEIKQVDGGKGFVTKRSILLPDNKRTAQMMYGIRILVDSVGIGRELDFVLLTIQAGSCLALMRTAAMVADFIMLYGSCFFSEDLQKKYYKCKVKETEDYSDLKDRLNIIQEHREEVSTLLRRGGVAKTLGLGPGGRGGIASQIMKR